MIHDMLALYNHARGKYEKAMIHYKKAMDRDTKNVRSYSGYGLLLLKDGRELDAQEVITKGIGKLRKKGKKQEYPLTEWMQLHSNLALTYWKMGELDKSIEEYETLFKRGKNTTLYGSLGFLLIAQGDATGDYTRAVAFNEEAYEYESNDHVILDNLGQLYFRTGDYDRAESMLREALKLRPLQVDSLYYLAKTLEQLDRREEASGFINKALDEGTFGALNTVSREAAEALRDGLTA